MDRVKQSAETAQSEGWAFLTPEGVGAHYFRDGKSFCGRALPAGVEVRGDVFGAGSDPEECRRCAKRAHDEADALDAAADDDDPDADYYDGPSCVTCETRGPKWCEEHGRLLIGFPPGLPGDPQ